MLFSLRNPQREALKRYYLMLKQKIIIHPDELWRLVRLLGRSCYEIIHRKPVRWSSGIEDPFRLAFNHENNPTCQITRVY